MRSDGMRDRTRADMRNGFSVFPENKQRQQDKAHGRRNYLPHFDRVTGSIVYLKNTDYFVIPEKYSVSSFLFIDSDWPGRQ
jgi:hypothetical protein